MSCLCFSLLDRVAIDLKIKEGSGAHWARLGLYDKHMFTQLDMGGRRSLLPTQLYIDDH